MSMLLAQAPIPQIRITESIDLLSALPTDQYEEVGHQEVQFPTLTIEEQPAQFYRFRYESEVERDGNRVGGLLLGRNCSKDNKSFMKVRVSDINPAMHSQLQLTVCTVSAEEKAPHPYYLHGDSCRDGFFELKKSVDAATGRDFWDITFERLAVICVPKKKKEDIRKGMEARRKHVPQLADFSGQPEPSKEYTSSSLGRIRLAFSLSFTDTSAVSSCWCLGTVFSDEIVSDKEKKSIEVDCLNPVEVPMEGGCSVAIHTKSPTTGIQKNGVKVHFIVTLTGGRTAYVRDLEEIRKHLLVVKAPDMRGVSSNDRLKCKLNVHSHGFECRELDIMYFRPSTSTSTATPGGNGNTLKRPWRK